jgi:integrase
VPSTNLYGVTGEDGAPRGAKSSWAGYLSVCQTSGLSPSQPAFEVLSFCSFWGLEIDSLVPPKSAKGQRGIALTPFVVDTLKKYQKIRSGEGACEDGLHFPNLQGEPMRPSTISQHFERLAKRTGLPPTVRSMT